MDKMTPIVFSARDLRFCMVEGDCHIHIGFVFFGTGVRLDTPLNDGGIPRLYAQRCKPHRNFRSGGGLLKKLYDLLIIMGL
jgi:hypothetical protein